MGRKLRASAPRRDRRQPDPVTKVRPEVAARALELANGDASRIRVIDSETVLVRNRGKRE